MRKQQEKTQIKLKKFTINYLFLRGIGGIIFEK